MPRPKKREHSFMTRDELLSYDAIASNYKVLKAQLGYKYQPLLDALVKQAMYYGYRLYGHTREEQRKMLDKEEEKENEQ